MRTLTITVALGLWGCCGIGHAEEPVKAQSEAAQGETKSFHFWMDVKLEESQAIFAAMTTADYEAIVKSAETLKTLSRVEGFVRRKNPKYRTQLRSFEFATREIEYHGKRENIEGVVLGFNQLTLSCVNCHKQLRDVPNGVESPPAR